MHEELQLFCPDRLYHPFFISMCGYSYCDGGYKINRRCSDVTVFEYIMEGTGVVQTNQTIFYPSKGDVYLLHIGDSHLYYSDVNNPWTKVWFNVRGDLVDSLILEYGLRQINHVPGCDLYSLFAEMVEITRSDAKNQEIFDRCALQFHSIVQKISAHVHANQKNLCDEALILQEYIQKNLDRIVSIEELCRTIHRSPAQVNKIFKSAFSVTPYEYLLDRKIETAKLLLKSTNMKIKDISKRLGFADEHYFSNYFKQRIGVSPRQFRAASEI